MLESGFLRTWIANALAPPELRVLDGLDAVAEGGGDLTSIAPWSAPWFSEPADSAYWAARGPAPGSVSDELPALVIAGWYDCFVGGSLRSFSRRHGPRDRLIVGPWGHEPSLTHLIGERALGSAGRPRSSACAGGRSPSTGRCSTARSRPGLACWPTSCGPAAGSSSNRGRRPERAR